MSKLEILAVDGIHPMYRTALDSRYRLHSVATGADTVPLGVDASNIVGIAGGGESKVNGALIRQLPRLRAVSIFGVGYDGVDVPAAKSCGVTVTHTPDVLSDDVADLAIGLMLAVARKLVVADCHVRAGRWPSGGLPLAKKVSGSKLGIVGMGRIGQAIATRATAFNMKISYTSRTPKASLAYTYVSSVEVLAREVEFLIVITPGGQETKHLVDANVLAALGTKGYLINVARGSVVDQEALIRALQNGGIAGAALDVFSDEPNVPRVLWDMQNVVLTPHIASATSQTRQAMADLAFANMNNVTHGLAAITPVPEMEIAHD